MRSLQGPWAGLLVALAARAASAAYAGPFLTFLEKIYDCESGSSDNTYTFHATSTPFNARNTSEPQRITGNFTGKVQFDDTHWARVQIDQKRGREWKESVINVNVPSRACTGMRENFPSLVLAVFGKDAMSYTPCYTEARPYVFTDEPVSWVFPKVPVFPYGTFRFNMKAGKEKAIARLCVNALMHTVPKPTTRG